MKAYPKWTVKPNGLLWMVCWAAMLCFLLGSCYQPHHRGHAAYKYSERQIDSLSFFSTHHYTNNYNFVVKADSLSLLRQVPEEFIEGLPTDSFNVHKGDHLVVADIRIVSNDPVDSVWVQLANDSSQFGWARETRLLPRVMPDDPISQFISEFSNDHVLIFLCVIALFAAGYAFWSIKRHKAHIVHFHDIDSFYPTLLCLIVAFAALLYASLQMYVPQMWQHFYYHPTLNPFSVPKVLTVFLCLVWSMPVVTIAAIDDIRRQLSFGEGVLYVGGLAAMCAVDYIVFSITTLHYVGYVLFVAYVVFAVRSYSRVDHGRYICGNCGTHLDHKGVCPKCGAINE